MTTDQTCWADNQRDNQILFWPLTPTMLTFNLQLVWGYINSPSFIQSGMSWHEVLKNRKLREGFVFRHQCCCEMNRRDKDSSAFRNSRNEFFRQEKNVQIKIVPNQPAPIGAVWSATVYLLYHVFFIDHQLKEFQSVQLLCERN